jgi:hypothetical protein
MSLLGAFLTATLENSGEPHKKNWKLTPKKKNWKSAKKQTRSSSTNYQSAMTREIGSEAPQRPLGSLAESTPIRWAVNLAPPRQQTFSGDYNRDMYIYICVCTGYFHHYVGFKCHSSIFLGITMYIYYII